MRRVTAEEQTKSYLSSSFDVKPKGLLTLKEKRVIDKALQELDGPEATTLQIELSSETMQRLLRNGELHLNEVRCLNKSSKETVCRSLLRSCRCI